MSETELESVFMHRVFIHLLSMYYGPAKIWCGPGTKETQFCTPFFCLTQCVELLTHMLSQERVHNWLWREATHEIDFKWVLCPIGTKGVHPHQLCNPLLRHNFLSVASLPNSHSLLLLLFLTLPFSLKFNFHLFFLIALQRGLILSLNPKYNIHLNFEQSAFRKAHR